MNVPGRSEMLVLGIALLGVIGLSAESFGTEPTRTATITTRSTGSPRILVFKGTPQERAAQLQLTPQASEQEPKNVPPPPQLTAAEASDMIAAAGISIQPAMLGSKKPFTLSPASPRSTNGAFIQFMGVFSATLGPTGASPGGTYYFSGPQEGWTREVQLHVPPSALIVGKTYLVDFAVYCQEPATWRVYVAGASQETKLQPGSQHLPVLVSWQGTTAGIKSFSLNLINVSSAWRFYSATVTELP
jgi:hypothetical protein